MEKITIHNSWGDLTIQVVNGNNIQIALNGHLLFSGNAEESEGIFQFLRAHFNMQKEGDA